jgi:hypothetical protein
VSGQAGSFLTIGSMLLSFATGACGGDSIAPADPSDPDTAQVVSSIVMRPPQLYIDSVGLTVQTSAVAYARDGRRLYSSAENPSRFSWSSSAPGVLRVDQNGSMTSESWGTATVRRPIRAA